GEMAQRLQGSPDLYGCRGPAASVNFVTCHDGFTLQDLVSYDRKHNEANGEGNRDGADDNDSWNCGAEGPATDRAVNRLRRRQVKNALAMLLVSQGVPMLLMGDEVGRSQGGNNNAYCQDNDISWLDWRLLGANAELFSFVKRCLAFRKAHPVLRNRAAAGGEIAWHGFRAWDADWSWQSRGLAFMLTGGRSALYVAMNMHWESHLFELPAPPAGSRWHVFVNTSLPPPEDVWPPGAEPP